MLGRPPSTQGSVIPGMPLIRSWCRGDASRPLSSNPFPQSPCPPAPALSHTGAQETIAAAGGQAARQPGLEAHIRGHCCRQPRAHGAWGSSHRRAAAGRGSSARPYKLQLMAAEMPPQGSPPEQDLSSWKVSPHPGAHQAVVLPVPSWEDSSSSSPVKPQGPDIVLWVKHITSP